MVATTKRIMKGALLAAILLGAAATLHASGSSPPPRTPPTGSNETGNTAQADDAYAKGMDLAKSEQYKEARQIFEDLAAKQPKNPDVLNMLAYTQRKTGDLDQALDNYHAALKLKPKFPQAREYLGEAYLQAAMREAQTLKGYGSTDELHKLAAAFQEAASKLEANAKGDAKSGW